MKNTKCINCLEHKRCEDNYTSWIFFIIGLIATIAIRAVTVLTRFNPIYGKIAWYVGVGGFFIFFIYKFRILKSRAKLISQANLVNKVQNKHQLSAADFNLLDSILCSLTSNKERMNYFFIFALSAIALILALYFDFVR